MPMSYYKVFRVPCWVVLDQTTKSKAVLEYFRERGGRVQEWPGLKFQKYVEALKNKGFSYVWESKPLSLPEILVNRALNDLVLEEVNPYANHSFDRRLIHRINRMVKSDSDFVRIFDELVNQQEAIVLSQLFQVAEICHDDAKTNKPQLWVTEKPCNTSAINKIADKILTIGDTASHDINIKNVKKDKLEEYLDKKMVELFKL